MNINTESLFFRHIFIILVGSHLTTLHAVIIYFNFIMCLNFNLRKYSLSFIVLSFLLCKWYILLNVTQSIIGTIDTICQIILIFKTIFRVTKVQLQKIHYQFDTRWTLPYLIVGAALITGGRG